MVLKDNSIFLLQEQPKFTQNGVWVWKYAIWKPWPAAFLFISTEATRLGEYCSIVFFFYFGYFLICKSSPNIVANFLP
jgi:hypothetical protein